MTKSDSPPSDPIHNLVRERRHSLQPIFQPRRVAVVGATEKAGSVGRTILWNLISTPFGGTVYPVNPSRPSVLGIRAYPSILELPEQVDLAVIVTPAASVPGIVAQCAQAGVKGLIIISAGFKETGPEGAKLEAQVLELLHKARIRCIGPNCLGVMMPAIGLNATFASTIARPGSVGFISQSGALCTAVLDWSLRENVGFGAFISIGSMLDVSFGDLIDYLGDDPRIKSIVIYAESIGDPRAFLSAAREVALSKPIIVIKAGRTEAAAKAAASHTGSLTGSDEVLDAAFRRCGVVRVNQIAELFYLAEVLGKQPRPAGNRLSIVTNAGGPGVLATDSLIANGCVLANLAPDTLAKLNELLPAHWSHGNPIDVLGDASPQRYAQAVEIAAADPGSDGLMVILTPQAMTDPTQTAEKIKAAITAKPLGKPVLASWMGGAGVATGEDVLNRANIPTFPYPDTAARIFGHMWHYSYNLRALYETPGLADDSGDRPPDRALAGKIIDQARAAGRTTLTEAESKELLAAYGLPVVQTKVAGSMDEAVAAAQAIGFPVVLKLHSLTITHKTDVGGVKLNIVNEAGVREAYLAIEAGVREKAGEGHFQGVTVQAMIQAGDGYELILGCSADPQFGPVLLFGLGGQLVEVFKDRALGLPPLNTTLARRMMEQTKIFQALKGVRGRKPVDLAQLERLVVRFSQLVIEQPWIKEIDINPLLASPQRLVALDTRVLLYDAATKAEDLPKPAIVPYPSQYVGTYKLRDGQEVVIRPIRPEDEPAMVKFHQTLSEETVYLRYFRPLPLQQRVEHDRLARICFIDYDRDMALVAERKGAADHEIIGVGRLSRIHGISEAEFALLVSDEWQNRGLGTELLHRLVQAGKDKGLERISAEMLPGNHQMHKLCRQLGFTVEGELGGETVEAVLRL